VGEGNMRCPMGAGRVLVLDIVLMKRRIYHNESQEEYRASETEALRTETDASRTL